MTGTIVRPSEYAILRQMDEVYCAVMNEEFKAHQQRMNPPPEQTTSPKPRPPRPVNRK